MNLPHAPRSTDDEVLRRAKRRVGMKMGFLVHLTVYLLVNLGLWLMATAGGQGHWNLWTLGGWGIGLAVHGVVTLLGLSTDGMRERMLAGEVERLKRQASDHR
jgi:hypothetical protein